MKGERGPTSSPSVACSIFSTSALTGTNLQGRQQAQVGRLARQQLLRLS